MALNKSYTADFRWVLQAEIVLSEKNQSLQKRMIKGQHFPRGRLPHPFLMLPALRDCRGAGDITVLQGEPVAFWSLFCITAPSNSSHLVFALGSDAPQPKEEHVMKAWASWSISFSEAGWSSMMCNRCMTSMGSEDNATTIMQGCTWTDEQAMCWQVGCLTGFSSAAGGTELNASGELKQVWSLETANAAVGHSHLLDLQQLLGRLCNYQKSTGTGFCHFLRKEKGI